MLKLLIKNLISLDIIDDVIVVWYNGDKEELTMTHWDDEKFNSQTPPKTIACATCKYKAKTVEVAGCVVERYGYSMCDKYSHKPTDIVWGRKSCPYYEKE